MSEKSIKQFVYTAGMQRRMPVSGTFELTPRCNLSCKMCYIHMSSPEASCRGQELTTEQWLTIGRQAVKAGMIYLLLTGGEPMLRSDFTTIYSEMVRMGVMVSVNTNGTLVTPEIVECFRKHPPETVNVSLYGVSADTYRNLCGVGDGYAHAFDGIRMLKDAGIRVIINTTFTTCNRQDMEALVAFAREIHTPIRTAAYTFPPVRNGHENGQVCLTAQEQGRLNARFDYLSSSASQRASKAAYLRGCLEKEESRPRIPLPEKGRPSSCLAGRGLFWLAWNGEMYPCGMLSDFAVQSRRDFLDFDEMWKKTCEQTRAVFLPAACTECALRRVCPSCAAVTHNQHGNAAELMEDMCLYTKTYVHSFLELANAADGSVTDGEPSLNEAQGVEPFTCL